MCFCESAQACDTYSAYRSSSRLHQKSPSRQTVVRQSTPLCYAFPAYISFPSHNVLCVIENINEAQTALVKDPVRTAQ